MWESVKDFWAQPWKGAQDMSVTDWFLAIGLLIVLLAAWRMIFRHIEI